MPALGIEVEILFIVSSSDSAFGRNCIENKIKKYNLSTALKAGSKPDL